MKLIIFLICLMFFFIKQAWADAIYIPPNSTQAQVWSLSNGTPVEANLKGMGVSIGSDGRPVWNLPKGHTTNNPHFGSTKTSGGTVTATKTHPATFTDNYGNKATGKITTQTNAGSTSAVNKAATAVMAGAIAGNILNSPNATTAAEELGKGNFGAAAAHAAASLDWTGIGGGINGLKDAFNRGANAEARAAAQAKAQAAAQAAEQAAEAWKKANADSQKYLPNPETGLPTVYPNILITKGHFGGLSKLYPIGENSSGGTISGKYFEKIGWGFGDWNCFSFGCAPSGTSWSTVQTTPENYAQYADLVKQAVYSDMPKPTIEDFMLTQNELSNIIAQYLQKNLESNEALRNDILTMLWSSGELNPNNTQTAVTGSAGDNTFLTAPYTPAGSDQAQQTQFQVAPDGTVTATTIPRPDLAANTSQAPTRQQVGQTNTATQAQTQAPKEQASASAPDICAMNPNSLMCAEMGSADYEDITLPENKINLDFEPTNTFSTDGICPAPKTFNVYGNTFNLSYQPACDFARGARPMIIMLGMVIAMGMAYAAVKEL